jgi:hypothetical protein
MGSTESIQRRESNPVHVLAQQTIPVQHTLRLGQHTLVILEDNSIDLFVQGGEVPGQPENGLHLDSEETYRLFISLWEQFK